MVSAPNHLCSDRATFSPYTGTWEEIPLDRELHGKFAKKIPISAHGARKDNGERGMVGTRVIAKRNPITATPRQLVAIRTRITMRNRPRLFAVVRNPISHLPNLNPAGYVVKAVAPCATWKRKNRRHQ